MQTSFFHVAPNVNGLEELANFLFVKFREFGNMVRCFSQHKYLHPIRFKSVSTQIREGSVYLELFFGVKVFKLSLNIRNWLIR